MKITTLPHWHNSEAFESLRNIVFNDRLVCLTGAGISTGLRRASDPTKPLPGWWELLDELRKKFPPKSQSVSDDVDLLLKERSAPGIWLSLAATLLRNEVNKPEDFDKFVRSCVEVVDPTIDPAAATSEAHRAIAELAPRGIMTFNYDEGHENQWSDEDRSNWKLLTPFNENALRDLIRADFSDPFLLKAHGSLHVDKRLVLDLDSYRELLVKNPTYRAFVGRLLTQFNLLIVGFGMSDPDFDEFLNLISIEIGGPVRKHVLLTKGTVDTAEGVVLKRRYGIETLGLGNWGEIPKVLQHALEQPSREAVDTIENCVSDDFSSRQKAHEQLTTLSRPGKSIVSSAIRDELLTAMKKSKVHEATEYIYSLGKLGRNVDNKKLLLEQLDPSNHREIIAHAILALDGKLDYDDTKELEAALAALVPEPTSPIDPRFPDPDNRIPLYLAYLIAQNRRRFAEDDPSLRKAPMPFKVSVEPR